MPNRIFIREVFFRKALVDHCDCRGMLLISGSEEPSTLQLQLHDSQVIGFDKILKCHGQLTQRWHRTAYDPEVGFVVALHRLRSPTKGDALHARQGGYSVVKLAHNTPDRIGRSALVR